MLNKHGKEASSASVRHGEEPKGTSSPIQPGELLKNLAVSVGSMGSLAAGLAVLFFWLGNAIVISRLRVYNLYGLVSYTDEYVKEAGYQFLQDVFTCFGRPTPILVVFIVIGFIIYHIPLGPFPGRVIPPERDHGLKTQVWSWARYAILPVLTCIAILGLVSDRPMIWIIDEILEQKYLLDRISRKIDEKPLIFYSAKEERAKNISGHKGSFFYSLAGRLPEEAPPFQAIGDELCQYLNKLKYPCNPKKAGELRRVLDRLQTEYKLPWSLPENLEEQVQKSELICSKIIKQQTKVQMEAISGMNQTQEINQTMKELDMLDAQYRDLVRPLRASEVYRTLRINAGLNDLFQEQVRETDRLITLISGLLEGQPPDTSVLALIASHHRAVNSSLQRLRALQETVNSLFSPVDKDSRQVMEDIKKVPPFIRFGRIRLSFAFWILVALIIYFVLNIPRVLKFRQWEVTYFIVMLVMLLVLAEIVPTTYGKYNFEFRIQRLQNICFSGKDKTCDESHPIKADLRKSLNGGDLYILMGPTKGKEIVLGTIIRQQDIALRIVMMDREMVKYMEAMPVEESKSLEIIKTLIRTKPSVDRLEVVPFNDRRQGGGPR